MSAPRGGDLDVLVVGAGPYGLATARAMRARGFGVEVLGRPMGFWREHMPEGMLLRSGPDWHMDPLGELTFEAFCGDPPDPIPLELFLDYADWFQRESGIEVIEDEVTRLGVGGDGFEAWTASGRHIKARKVVAAPGVAYFTQRPGWAPEGAHTCDLVDFKELSGARVLIVGGRQSAYEWAALIHEQGAEQVTVVHRHEQPRFAPVSWSFVDQHIDSTLAQPGWWRRLPQQDRDAIGRRFWEVGRLTLEPWLAQRIRSVDVHARAEVVQATAGAVDLSDGTHVPFDRIVFATGYTTDLGRVPYLPPLPHEGLDENMQSALEGLYLPGFAATKDFGPFFGFVKGAPAAGSIVADHIEAHTNG
jgi:cation diffusion facilitator CzcD-associated flavoprotein CzcO